MDLMVQVPKLISQNLDQKFKDFIFLFNLYHKIEQKNFLKIYINFPYMMCQDTAKIQRFLGEFKKYKLTQQQVMKLCGHSGGLLGSKVSNFFGLYESLKYYGLKSKDINPIFDELPEFALQNRKDLLNKKIQLIQEVSGRDNTYIRNFIKRHPDIVMK